MILDLLDSKVRVAREDKEVIYSSLLSLAGRLRPAWNFLVSVPGIRKEPLSRESLRSFFNYHFEKVQKTFLEKERQAGKPWATIAHYINCTSDPNEQTERKNHLRLLAWSSVKGRFLEGLCLMATLNRMSATVRSIDVDLFAQVGPLEVRDENQICFIWTQQSVESFKTGLKALPDIVITNTSTSVTTSNILSIIECKCRETLGANDIRGEFGKAYDLGSSSYILVSYNAVTKSLIDAGKELGIEIQVFSLNTPEREQFIRGERDVGADMAQKLALARKRRMFLTAIEDKTAQIKRRGN